MFIDKVKLNSRSNIGKQKTKMKKFFRAILASVLAVGGFAFFSSSVFAAGPYTCTWTGATNNNFSVAGNWSGCNSAAPQPGDDDNLIFDNSALGSNTTLDNDITGLNLTNIEFTGSNTIYGYVISGNSITITGGVTDDSLNGNTAITASLIASGNQAFSSASETDYSDVEGSGNITVTGGGTVNISEANNGTGGLTSYTGAISSTTSQIILSTSHTFTSSGSATVSGTGALTLFNEAGATQATWDLPVSVGGAGMGNIGPLNIEGSGQDSTDTLSGSLTLTSDVQIAASGHAVLDVTGTLTDNGFVMSALGNNEVTVNVQPGDDQTGLDVIVGSGVTYYIDGERGNATVESGGKLKGVGSVTGLLVDSGGYLSPGDSGTGCFTVNGNLTMDGTYQAQFNNTTACSGYDQVNVSGTVNIGGNLQVSMANGCKPQKGQTLPIINNNGSQPVTGTFTGQPQGSTITTDGYTYIVSYDGGSNGNSVVLTVKSVPPASPDTGTGLSNGHAILSIIAVTAASSGIYLISRKVQKSTSKKR